MYRRRRTSKNQRLFLHNIFFSGWLLLVSIYHNSVQEPSIMTLLRNQLSATTASKNRLFRVPASKRLHSFAALRNWLRQPLQSLSRFKIENLEFHLLETFLVFKTFEKSFGYLWRKMRGNYENP